MLRREPLRTFDRALSGAEAADGEQCGKDADRCRTASVQRLAHRQPLEPPEVAGEAPRYRIAGADRPVATDGRDQRDDRTAHTATGALMAGQGS